MKEIKVSVTALASFCSRSGSLSSGSYGSVSGIEGTRLHNKIFSDLREQYGSDITTEYYLSSEYSSGDILLQVSGRADVLLETPEGPGIIEIKSFNSSKDSFAKLVRPEHEAQLALYGAMFLMEYPEIQEVKITLRYVSVTTLEAFEDTRMLSRDEANDIFEHHCSEYSSFAAKLLNYEESSLISIASLKFPYPVIRSGQSQFMKQALKSLSSKEALFALAPTGTGKTISTLYPAVKGLLKGKYDKIFYLTAKTATRVVATKALNDMRAGGLILRSILLSSKESMCPMMRKCDAKFCKLADNYYSRVKPALEEILVFDEITPELITKIAMKHHICPHEFSLDTMNYCTVVIGDYNHAFDPRVSLVRAFGDEAQIRNVLLIDEAHNMVDRAREMYSVEFPYSILKEMMKLFKGKDARIESLLTLLDRYFTTASDCFLNGTSVFAANEDVDEKKVLKTSGFEATRQRPMKFYTTLWRCIKLLSPYLDSLEAGKLRDATMEFFFEARFFLTVFELYYNDSYVTSITKMPDDIIIKLVCLDSSEMINRQIEDKMAAIFFSATLSPYEYYRNVLIGKNAGYSRSLELPSPFPSENLEILIDSSISTAYKNRAITLDKLCTRIMKELVNRRGNYMIFFPSFEYLNLVCEELQKRISSLNDTIKRKLIRQKPGMDQNEKKEFLDMFSSPYDGCLIGAGVLGGHFGEGIDLVGDRLSGVIIVGVGIPKITPEREILKNYYDEKFGDGFAFAYRFPGWEKVLQAVGRVIRTEEDTGFALLIDDRLERSEYISLYPENWKV